MRITQYGRLLGFALENRGTRDVETQETRVIREVSQKRRQKSLRTGTEVSLRNLHETAQSLLRAVQCYLSLHVTPLRPGTTSA
jgi:hypothetical protein